MEKKEEENIPFISYNLRWKTGCHTTFEKNIFDTLSSAVFYGMRATQFFMGNPKSFTRAKINQSDIKKSNLLLARFPTDVFTHYPYLANLAGTSKESLAWDGDAEQDTKTTKLLKSISEEIQTISKLDSKNSGVVVHPGAHKNKKGGLKAISTSINKIDFQGGNHCKLILENAAGQGKSLATTLEEIKSILDGVEEKKKPYVGVCIDTCHLFAYGEYDISKVEEVDRFFVDFNVLIGLEKLCLFHLNDSLEKLGSKMDRHAGLGTGHIWGKSTDSLVHLLNLCAEREIPVVLETSGLDMLFLANLENSLNLKTFF